MPCVLHQVHHHIMGYNISVLSLHSWLHKGTSFGVWYLADIPLYNGKRFWTFLAFEDGLRCRFRHYNHAFKGWKLVLETIYFESRCTSKQVEKVLKVKLKFTGSKSGHPTDDLLWSSGRPTAILGVRMPGRPLNLNAASRDQRCCEWFFVHGDFCKFVSLWFKRLSWSDGSWISFSMAVTELFFP